MTLSYRALLVPTAAIDSAGRAKPEAVFSVTPMAGGSPVAVYGVATGGSALAADQIKTDALGNISGFYVAEPGPYTLSFAGGGTVVTSAVMDSRDVATSGDLADALVGAGGPVFVTDPVESYADLVNDPILLASQDVNINSVPEGDGWVGGPEFATNIDPGGVSVLRDGIYLVRVGTQFDIKDLSTSATIDRRDLAGYTQVKLKVYTTGSYTPGITWQTSVDISGNQFRYDHVTLYLPAGTVLSGSAFHAVESRPRTGSPVDVQPYLSTYSLSIVRFL